MTDSSTGQQPQAFKLKGTMPALTLLHMLTEDLDAIDQQLADHLRQMPQFFLYAPVLVDLSEIGDRRLNLSGLADLLRRHRLVPVAVRNPNDTQQVQAVAAGWGVLQSALAATRHAAPQARPAGASANPRRVRVAGPDPIHPEAQQSAEASVQDEPANLDQPVPPAAGLTIRTPVRSGQVIHAVGGDLVVIAPVSSGAELIADGNIHVYGAMRGRALAGARGDSDASIFCLGLEAEFLSIAGHYLNAEQIGNKYKGRPTRAHLVGELLTLTPM